MSAHPTSALAPDAVRVWRGFRDPAIDIPAFYERLNTVFVPATVLMQIEVGLDSYIPSVLAGVEDKPDDVPDETAILFWGSQQTYRDGFKTLAVRTYTLTHGAVYTASSGAGFPVPFTGELQADQPYFLIDAAADWMHGTVHHLVGARPAATPPERFRSELATVLSGAPEGEVRGAIACAGENYIVYWELEDGQTEGRAERFAALAERAGWSHTVKARPVSLDGGLWENWPGIDMQPGNSLNLQFQRRWEGRT